MSAIDLIKGRVESGDLFREHAYGLGAQRSILRKVPRVIQGLVLALQGDNRVNGSRSVPPAFAPLSLPQRPPPSSPFGFGSRTLLLARIHTAGLL